jgi:hypothetical protein
MLYCVNKMPARLPVAPRLCLFNPPAPGSSVHHLSDTEGPRTRGGSFLTANFLGP